MSTKTYINVSSVFTPFGLGIKTNWSSMHSGKSAIQLVNKDEIKLKNFFASAISNEIFDSGTEFLKGSNLTRLEKLMVATITDVQQKAPFPLSSKDTAFVFSTTKGNIDLLSEDRDNHGLSLHVMGKLISTWFQNPNSPIVISNACISGISAMIMAKNLLEQGEFKQVIVCGGDILSEFTVAGFHSLNAISPFPCKPFDKDRQGLSPGEGCGVLVLTLNKPETGKAVFISGTATSNDANHISGPSRTGEGLHIAIEKAISLAKVERSNIGYINAHGTATLYNDESESLAITRSSLEQVPMHSLKGYIGHTFGAAGLIESAIALECINKNEVLTSLGYSKHGVSVPLNITTSNFSAKITHVLKTASGFGGCNAALILSTDD